VIGDVGLKTSMLWLYCVPWRKERWSASSPQGPTQRDRGLLVELLERTLLGFGAEEEDGDCGSGKATISIGSLGTEAESSPTKRDNIEASVGAKRAGGRQSSEHTREGDGENTGPAAVDAGSTLELSSFRAQLGTLTSTWRQPTPCRLRGARWGRPRRSK